LNAATEPAPVQQPVLSRSGGVQISSYDALPTGTVLQITLRQGSDTKWRFCTVDAPEDSRHPMTARYRCSEPGQTGTARASQTTAVAISASSRRETSATRPIAVFQSISTCRPLSRASGGVSLSGDAAHGMLPYRPLGPSRPWLTMSVARPRTPTIRPSLTAMSQPQPLLHHNQALCTHRSASASVGPSPRHWSTRAATPWPRGAGCAVPR
jgi:hypothetical protein